nr:4Fe-4S binding protein [candidate division Zixibacteria bacterium]
MELVILSGKGGTGKTSLVGSLAVLAENKILVDCDVDAADLDLIIQGEKGQPNEFTASKKAIIDSELCTDCGICREHCRFNAIEYNDTGTGGSYRIDPLACEGCGLCVYLCPDKAIGLHPVVSGQWFLSKTDYGPLIHANLGIAQGNSGRLVSLLRKTARDLAESEGRELIIVDGPPGIGCPVIASLTGADYVVLVTEPSKSAFHDLERIISLVSHFRLPLGICINKFDINPALTQEIENFAIQKGIVLLGRIPYDPEITRAQIAGKPVIEFVDNETGRLIRQIWEKILGNLKYNNGRKKDISKPLKLL